VSSLPVVATYDDDVEELLRLSDGDRRVHVLLRLLYAPSSPPTKASPPSATTTFARYRAQTRLMVIAANHRPVVAVVNGVTAVMTPLPARS
jgi:hypothetical protein